MTKFKLRVHDCLGNFISHTLYMSTPSDLSLDDGCFDSSHSCSIQHLNIGHFILPLDAHDAPNVFAVEPVHLLYMSGISCPCLTHMQEGRYDHSFVDCKFGWEFETSLSQDLRLIAELPHTSHTHGHTDECMRHNTELLDETNTATELRGSAVTSQGTLATGDNTTMAFPKEEFPPPHGCKSMEIVCALNLLIAKRRTSTQYVPFLKSLLWLFWCLNHRPPRFGTEARTITPPSLLFDFLELNSYTMSIIELVPSLLTKTFFVLRRTGLASIGHSTCYRPCFAERVAGIKVTITYLYF